MRRRTLSLPCTGPCSSHRAVARWTARAVAGRAPEARTLDGTGHAQSATEEPASAQPSVDPGVPAGRGSVDRSQAATVDRPTCSVLALELLVECQEVHIVGEIVAALARPV